MFTGKRTGSVYRPAGPGITNPRQRGDGDRPPLHPGKRVDLDSGVRWEQLTLGNGEGVDFLLAFYEVGGASTPDETLMRHKGREYGM